MKKIITALFLGILYSLNAQDVHLSQFYTSDHLLNPAIVGNHDGDYRVIANYRNQWRQIVKNQSITTFLASYDRAFRFKNQEIDGGILMIRDLFSGFQTQTIKFILTGSYGINFKGFHLRTGLQAGFVSNSTDLTKQTFPAQWNYQLGMIDPSASNLETSLRRSHNYLDLNWGIYGERNFGKIKTSAGLSLNHLNRPKDTYFQVETEKRRVRKIFHAAVTVPITSIFDLQPKLQWMWTTNANEYLFGSNLDYKTNHPLITKLWIGSYFRHGVIRNLDAFYPVVGLSYKRFDFGLSYDINISELSQNVKRVKSFEFSLIYTAPSSKVKYRIIPCARY